MKHPIPREALDDRLGFIGTSGSGKTYNAGTAVEILLASHKARVVIIDPLGVWWGLRLLADGKKPSNFNVVIFGGDHADLPLNEQAGALIGETAATMAESCIVDLSKMPSRSAERRFMVAFLETIYRKAGGEPFHLIVDEADLFAPQKPQAGDEVLLGHMENIVRRGRVRGFIPWLISQRPAVLNKNVLSQVDGLLAFKLTSVQDRDALDAWIEGQADKAQGKAIKDALPTFPVGEGVVWLPGHGILERQKFPPKITFDSSKKPKRGEKQLSRRLEPLDVDRLKDRLASVVEEVKANDPKELRRRIAELQAAARKAPAADPKAVEDAEKRGFERGKAAVIKEAQRVGQGALVSALADMEKLVRSMVGAIDAATVPVTQAIAAGARTAKIGFPDVSGNVDYKPSTPAALPRAASSAPPRMASRAKPHAPTGDGPDLGAERRPLAALAAVYPAGMTEAQWAVAAGLKRSGGTWATYLSRLRTAACIERRGDEFFATETGMASTGEAVVPLPPPGPELVRFWKSKISGVGPMMDVLAGHYPRTITREELAAELGLAASGGTFSTYVSRLRSPGLIEVEGPNLRCSPSLMGDA